MNSAFHQGVKRHCCFKVLNKVQTALHLRNVPPIANDQLSLSKQNAPHHCLNEAFKAR